MPKMSPSPPFPPNPPCPLDPLELPPIPLPVPLDPPFP